MPILEHVCETVECPNYGLIVEHFYWKSDIVPVCPECGREMTRLASRFAVAFSGAITARYNDPQRENPRLEEHTVCERNTPDGKPKWTTIRTWQERKDFMRREKLEEVGNVEADSSGKLSPSRAGVGMSGQWV